jgi:hypothetical protein
MVPPELTATAFEVPVIKELVESVAMIVWPGPIASVAEKVPTP